MDWSNMHAEILELILSNVFGENRDNFSLVCAWWNNIRASSLHCKSPCLVFPNRTNHNWRVYQHNYFYSMDFPIPDKNATIRCSKRGWSLMSRDDHTLFFFNFFNNQKIEVPDTPTRGYTTISFFHPPTSSKCFIIGIESVGGCPMAIGFLRHGEDKWKIGYIYLPTRLEFQASLSPPVFLNEKLYFLDTRGNLISLDIAFIDKSEDQINEHGCVFWKCHKQRRRSRNIKEHFLVKPEDEDTIFAVFVMHEDRKVRVFKLLEDGFWEPVNDLRDKVFYVSNAACFSYATQKKSMANKIFFPKFHDDDNIVFYSLDTRKYHSFDGKYSSENAYGLKKFDATWMTPAQTPQSPRELLTWCSQGDHIVS